MLDDGDGATVPVYMDEDGNETPSTFSELEAYPEYANGPLADAWQELVDRDSDMAQAFEDAISELAERLTGR